MYWLYKLILELYALRLHNFLATTFHFSVNNITYYINKISIFIFNFDKNNPEFYNSSETLFLIYIAQNGGSMHYL